MSNETLRSLISDEGYKHQEVSGMMGFSPEYLGSYFSSEHSLGTRAFVRALDVIGYDLVARCRSDGFEFRIPPE